MDVEERVRQGLSALVDSAQLPAVLPADAALHRGRRRRVAIRASALIAAAAVVSTAIAVPLAVSGGHQTPRVKPAASQSPPLLTVPDVTLQRLAAATRTLTAAGFAVQISRETGLEPLGVVIYESPAAGSLTLPGTTITLTISAGPDSSAPSS
jgi:hypothetical protein